MTVLFTSACSDGSETPGDTETEDGTDAEHDTPAEEIICEESRIQCGSDCVDPLRDHSHCGECGNECAAAEVCNHGLCQLECPPGWILCESTCVDIQSDIENCSACGLVCEAGDRATPVCESGLCSIICEAGWVDENLDGSCESECISTSIEELCNGLDDDCDGRVDEDFDCNMGRAVRCTTACDTEGLGVCGYDCTVPGPGGCVPPDERCNGIDDDCDTVCDNGFECCRRSVDTGSSCGEGGTEYRTCREDCLWSTWRCIGAGPCTPDVMRECGRCGVSTCAPDGEWSTCLGEGACYPEDVEAKDCGACGRQSHVCQDDCSWPGWWEQCSGAGVIGEDCNDCGMIPCLEDGSAWGECVGVYPSKCAPLEICTSGGACVFSYP